MAQAKNNGKETIYVDVDDEITNIIDKVKTSEHKIIALVLPKRASVMQSVVNMKLLKRAAVSSKKSIVLITSEQGLLPLAGVAGVHVAKSLQTKPYIPSPPAHPGEDTELAESLSEDEADLDKSASVGALAAAAIASDDDEPETIELDNVDMSDAAPAEKAASKLKHLKVPNFERFRSGFFLAGLGVFLLIFGWYLAFVVMPKANIIIRTDTTSAVSSFDFTVSTAQTELELEDRRIPATLKELAKIDSEKVPATGQRDDGTKASGSMTLKNCSSSDNSISMPAGSNFTSGGFVFTSDEAVTLPASSFSGGGACTTQTRTVDVIANAAGDSYNLEARTYSTSVSGVQASGSDMKGGTTKLVKVVSQKDIDDALSKIKARIDQQAEAELLAMFDTEELFGLPQTRKNGEAKVTATPELNKEGTEVTVTSETVYTMLGIEREDLSTLIKEDVKGDIDTERQAIINDGIGEAIIRINNQPSNNEAFISFRTSVTAGPQLDEAAIKEAVRGKKRGEVEQYISQQPGVEEVIVEYSPFWVYSTPKAAKKITITIENPQVPETTSEEAEDAPTDEQ